ncbi:MAG: elongation factor G, partial [Coriobacteriales bacterium]|nr:elongation factor G [Coriobacteriales bacterium]
FKTYTDEETGQTIIAGMGELHLEIIIDRLKREFKVDCNTGAPRVAYREKPGHEVLNARGLFKRQTGGSGQYGDAIINMYPGEPGSGFVFENKIVGGVIPKEYIPSVGKGIEEALETGVVAGYPTLDVRVELVDGSYHDVDSSEVAFKVAGSLAIKEALRKSDPILLEPMMAVEVETPSEYMGNVMGGISSRRGMIQGQEERGSAIAIKANVPLSEMFGYATDLRSNTQGRASYTMQFAHYAPVPKNVAEEIIAKSAK